MEDETSSKKERATAKRLFTMASNRVTKGINEKIDIVILQERFQKVKFAWDDILQKHAAYLCVKYPDDKDVDPSELTWLQTVEDEFELIEKNYENYNKIVLSENKINVDKNDNSEREAAKRVFILMNNRFNKAIDDDLSAIKVQERFQDVKSAWEDVMKKHANRFRAEDTDESGANDIEKTWFQAIEREFELSEKNMENYVKIHPLEDVSKQAKVDINLKKAQKTCKFEENNLTSIIEGLKTLCAKDEIVIHTTKEVQEEMKIQLERYRSAQREYVLLLDEDDTVNQELKRMGEMQQLFMDINLRVGEKIEQEKKRQDISQAKDKTSSTIELKMERMKMPTFNGDIRDYPRFKSDFMKYVMPSLKSEDSAAYVLRSCLSGEPKTLVKNVEDTLSDIWGRLDERFGRVSKITDAIMYDIKQLRPVTDGDEKKFIDLVNTVEKSYRDLSALGLRSEMANSTIISLIEERMPYTTKKMWCLEISEKNSIVDERNKFPHLLEFLLKHRRAIEYGSSDLRTKKTGKNSAEAPIHHLKREAEYEDNVKSDNVKESKQKENASKIGYCWYHSTNKHDILSCNTYKACDIATRWDLVYDYRACACCLGSGHRSKNCYKLKECGVNGCKETHHPTLHDEKYIKKSVTVNSLQQDEENKNQDKKNSVIEPVAQNHIGSKTKNEICLLQLMKVKAGGSVQSNVNVMWDSGAKVSMITFKKAKELGLLGVKTTISIIKIGADRSTIESKLYTVPLIDKNNNIEYFNAYGIEKISTSIEAKDISEMAKLLEWENIESIQRPEGEIELLIGFEYAGFHPEKIKSANHLLLMRNKFGYCIGGSHHALEEKTQLLVQEVQVNHSRIKIEDFYTCEALGVTCNPQCGGCKCGECPIGGKQYTLQQERELALIDKGLTLEKETWKARYPWIKDPENLPNNYNAAFAMLRSTERRLMKNPDQARLYQMQIDDMVKRGVAKRLSSSEMQEYNGPIYYLSHHEVMKPDSDSTPCRLVFNSSARYMNNTLNDYWAKGPDLLNNLLGVLIRFRENEVAIVGDISKMYHTVKTSVLDQHTHRFLWRDMESNRSPDIYVITSVSFGDKPAGAIAQLALRKTAESESDKYPQAADTLIKNTYMDDVLDSANSVHDAKKLTRDVDEVLSKGGFVIKKWTTTSETSGFRDMCTGEKTVEEDSKVLGITWNAQTDEFGFKTKLNFSEKKRKIRSSPNLKQEEIRSRTPKDLTKRMILSQVNGIYDPLGLTTPFTIRAKMMMRELSMENSGWDDPVTEETRKCWMSFFEEMFDAEEITYPRAVKPNDTVGLPVLVIFSDASEKAFGACAYVRWEVPGGEFESRLLLSKSRLAPSKRITMPRLELSGALLSARLLDFIKKHTRLAFKKAYMIVDSEIVRAMLQKESYGFNTFTGVRVGEIQALSDKEDWYWVEGVLNIADIITRGEKVLKLGRQSEWQNGPSFLRKKEDEWPLKKSYSGTVLPDQLVMNIELETEHSPSISHLVDIKRYSDYYKLLRVTARLLAICKSKPFSMKSIVLTPRREMLKRAEEMWLISAQENVKKEIKPETMKRLGVIKEDGILVVGARLETWENYTYDKKNPALISSKHLFAKLYSEAVHKRSHLGVSATAAKIRRKYWIVGLRQLLKSISYKCVTCRMLSQITQEQIMGKIPAERLNPAPAWSYISLDLFGPFDIKGEVNKRASTKGYGVIFNCLLSRAVHVDISTDYSTDSFILVLQRFISLRGCPIKIWSDRGSQLKSADREMKDVLLSIDEKAYCGVWCILLTVLRT